MRSVYSLCGVPIVSYVVFLFASPFMQPAPPLHGFTIGNLFFVWWLYIAPLFTFAAFALLVWKLWMETVPRNGKILAWAAVIVAACANILAAVRMIRIVYR
jgi:hypothetical protein